MRGLKTPSFKHGDYSQTQLPPLTTLSYTESLNTLSAVDMLRDSALYEYTLDIDNDIIHPQKR